MQKHGLFYCNTITYFSQLEDNDVRGDSFESVTKLKYGENEIWQFKPADNPEEGWKSLNVKRYLYKEAHKEPLGNLFCFSAFKIYPKKEPTILELDKRFFTEYKYGLLILNQDIFIEKIRKALQILNFKTEMHLVRYHDLNKRTGTKTLFQKDKKFNWQEEYRIVLHTDKSKKHDPFEFSIGSIEDISKIIDLSETKNFHYKL